MVTATNLRPERLAWLEAAHRSVHANDCAWTHWVVLDRADAQHLPGHLRRCPRVNIVDAGSTGAVGTGAARNIALYASPDMWVSQFDDDDILPPHSLDVRLAAATPADGWVGGLLQDLVDGVLREPWVQPAGPGRYQPGDMLAHWTDPATPFPYFGGTLLLRRTLAAALGGWGTMASDQDIFLHLTLTNLTPGCMVDAVVCHYRKHGGQRTLADQYRADRVARLAWMRDRAAAVYQLLHGTALWQ